MSLALSLLAGGCADKTPARIALQLPTQPLVSSAEVALAPRVLNKKGEVVESVAVEVATTSSDIAVVTSSMDLKCVASGDTVLVAKAGTVSLEEPIRCRLPKVIKGPASVEARVGEPISPQLKVLDENGKALDLDPVLESGDTSIVSVQGAQINPVGVGRVTVVARVGERQHEIAVRVIRKVKSEPILIADGGRLNIALSAGNFEARAQLKDSNGSKDGIRGSWVGGANCRDIAESQRFSAKCRLSAEGSLILENPTTWGMGAAVEGVLTIFEVPDET